MVWNGVEWCGRHEEAQSALQPAPALCLRPLVLADNDTEIELEAQSRAKHSGAKPGKVLSKFVRF